MLYPNKIKKENKQQISHANRGMDLENLINESNKYYLLNDKAIIYKKPTPVTISKVEYKNKVPKVTGLLEQKSTLDYVGLYKGKYIDFDAKVTKNKTSFPLSNIHPHQFKHIENIIKHNGISFILLEINQEIYLIPGEKLIEFKNNNSRQSIPYNYIKDNYYKIEYSINPVLDYIKVIEKIYFKEGEQNEKN